MPDLPGFVPVIIAVLVIALVFAAVVGSLLKNLVKVPPDQVAVFSGRGEMQMVSGGSKFKIPGIHRVDFLELRPYEVDVAVAGVHSINKVPVNVTAVATVSYGQSDEQRRTAASQWLNANRGQMDTMITNILAGALRSVIAKMTVEQLHESREELQNLSMEEAADAFGPFGMELQTFVVQTITDDNGYMDALGQGEIDEAKARADIRSAEAQRDALVKSSEADRAGQTARAEADREIDEANRVRDLRRAEIQGETEAEMARAAQAGPLAEAEASKNVGIAEEEARAARELAAVDVERQRTARAEQAQKADVVVPAAAQREAADLLAEAARVETVTAAEAEAQATRDKGAADAEARTAIAAAVQAELEAQAHGDRARLLAEADGEKAMLLARAEGEEQLAIAFNTYTPGAAQLYVLPKLIEELAAVTAAAAAPVGEIDNITIIGGGGEDGGADGAIQSLARSVPVALSTVGHVTKALTGIDVESAMNAGDLFGVEGGDTSDADVADVTEAVDPSGADDTSPEA